MRFEEHPAEQWTPVRFLRETVECDFCRFTIWKGSPGRTAGTRGTRCWWNAYRRVYECLGCRSEAMRADSARYVEQTGRAPELPIPPDRFRGVESSSASAAGQEPTGHEVTVAGPSGAPSSG